MPSQTLKLCLGALILMFWGFEHVFGEMLIDGQVCPPVLDHLSLDQCRGQPAFHDCPQFGCGDGRRCCPTNNTCGVRCSPTATKSICPIPADIALILDVSGSINDKDLGQVVEAFERFVDMYDISQEKTHIGIITYSSDASLALGFNDFQGLDKHSVNVKRVIDSTEIKPGQSNLRGALEIADDELFKSSSGGRDVKKFCIIITSGYQSSNSSGGSIIEVAQRVKAKGVSVNIVAVGSGDPSQDIYQTASSIDHVYHAKSTSSVSEQLNKIARNECQGCENVDVVVGFPNSLTPDHLLNLQNTVNTIMSMFHVTPRLCHIGIVEYNEDASLYRPLGQDYTLQDVQDSVYSIEPSPSFGYNTAAAMRVAADHAFTIYGGVRQSYSKAMVIFVPRYSTSSIDENQAASDKLKGMGVRIMVVGFGNTAPPSLYSTIVSDPVSEFLVNINNLVDLPSTAYQMSRHICEKPVIQSCFVPFDMVIAIDNSETITRNQFTQIKDFVKTLMQPYANSENNVHFGLITFASIPKKITDGFRDFRSQSQLYEMIDNLPKTNDPQRRVDIALEAIKRDFFSLEGGTRRGHTRYLLLISSGASSSVDMETTRIVTQSLDALGVQRITVGINKDPATIRFLQKLASENKLVFTTKDGGELADVAKEIQPHLCTEKPGKCSRPQEENIDVCLMPIPEDLIPCGASANKPSQSQRQNDWDCPGELKCCYLDIAKCHQVCRYPPIVSTEKKDILVLMENTDALGGRKAFELSKQFVRELVNAFDLSNATTRLSLATFTGSVSTQFKFSNKEFAESKYRALSRIQDLRFQGGRVGNTMEALRVAHDLLQPHNQARFIMNKTVILIGTGQIQNKELAARLGSRVRSNLADVFAVIIGNRNDYMTMKSVVSTPSNHTIFAATSAAAMKAQLRGLVDAISQGAVKDLVVSMMTSYQRISS